MCIYVYMQLYKWLFIDEIPAPKHAFFEIDTDDALIWLTIATNNTNNFITDILYFLTHKH